MNHVKPWFGVFKLFSNPRRAILRIGVNWRWVLSQSTRTSRGGSYIACKIGHDCIRNYSVIFSEKLWLRTQSRRNFSELNCLPDDSAQCGSKILNHQIVWAQVKLLIKSTYGGTETIILYSLIFNSALHFFLK